MGEGHFSLGDRGPLTQIKLVQLAFGCTIISPLTYVLTRPISYAGKIEILDSCKIK